MVKVFQPIVGFKDWKKSFLWCPYGVTLYLSAEKLLTFSNNAGKVPKLRTSF
jgi:hypothetical protein